MSGRGRGINNAPAWMTRGGYDGPPPGGPGGPGGPGPGGPGGPGPGGPGGPPDGGDMYGRGPPPPRGRGHHDRGPPPPDHHDRGPPPPDHYHRYDDRGPPPPDHYHRGGGGGGNFRGGPPPPRRGGEPPPRRGGGGGRDGGGRGGFYDEFANDPDNHMDDKRPPPGRGGGGHGGGGPQKGGPASKRWKFRSYEEERDFVETRRQQRLQRKSKFDVAPTPEQIANDAAAIAFSNPAATDFAGVVTSDRNFSALPQQTRHARRLYIGQLPANVTEEELHFFFKECIETSLVNGVGGYTLPLKEDPILSVYINHERRFCFLEFKTVEMTTACMALDGININQKGKVKVKRPNDYNPSMAPNIHPSTIPQLDTSKLGIISGTVPDGPNKIFVGGLHYHLTEEQVLELLSAFGKVKAFHLVKNDPDSATSKGYCFVEYIDPSITQIAVIGLNGMDLGGGKMLTARVAGERNNSNAAANTAMVDTAAVAAAALQAAGGVANPMLLQQQAGMPGMNMAGGGAAAAAIPSGANIVNGYDIDVLVDAAMGLCPMPTAPMHVDQFGIPITRVAAANPTPAGVATATPPAIPQQPQQQPMMNNPMAGIPAGGGVVPPPPPPPPMAQQQQPSALDIANKALEAVFGTTTTTAAAPPPQQPQATTPTTATTRILVLSNLVSDEDLATLEDYNMLKEEVFDECKKFGNLLSMEIPRDKAVKKIFLEYETIAQARNANSELSGRNFGPNVVQTSYLSEADYAAKNFQ